MKERVITILDDLKAKGAEGLTGGIIGYEAVSDESFRIDLNFGSHKTLLRYETTGQDEILRIEITHVLGHLDLTKAEDPTEFLLGMFEENVASFRGSGACLGLQEGSPFPLVSLNSTHQFMATLDDSDIAEILSITLFDLKMGLLFTYPPPIVHWD